MSSPAPPPAPAGPSLWSLPFRIGWASLTVALPLLGAWAASSIAAYQDAPLTVALLVGAAIFPLVPVLWELDALRRFTARRQQRAAAGKKPPRRFLTRAHRLVARTLLTSLAALGALLLVAPTTAFTALSARGDWMLDGKTGGLYDEARGVLFFCADRLEWAYNLALDNPYAVYDDDDAPPPDAPTAKKVAKHTPPVPDTSVPDARAPTPRSQGVRRGDALTWPPPPVLHPALQSMPKTARASIQSMGTYFRRTVPDAAERVKALHDFVATHLAYDAPALVAPALPPQNAARVFAEKKAVCAGYALLMVALGEVTGDRIVYVTGVSRDANGEIQSGAGHAWNAVDIDGRWSLMDVTWDAGHVDGGAFVSDYSTDYLFTPPDIFVLGHYPTDERWQLLEAPISRGAFIRQAPLRPAFFAEGFTLISPQRSLTEVGGDLVVELDNPTGRFVMATATHQAGGSKVRCDVAGTRRVRIACRPTHTGTHNVTLFSNDARSGTYAGIGHLAITRLP